MRAKVFTIATTILESRTGVGQAMNEACGNDEAFEYPADALGMSPAEMRRLGYRVVDLVVNRLCRKNSEPVLLSQSPAELMAKLGGPLPEQAGDVDAAIDLLASAALAHQQHSDHPRYFARVPGPSSFAGVLGDWLGIGFNTIAASWIGGAGPATVELVVVQWLRELVGMPPGTDGVLVSGGSMANLTAIATARATCGSGVAYLTDQTHSSIQRALRELGFPPDHIRTIASDEQFRMPVADLTAAIQQDLQQGNHPLIAIASAGTTNTGSVDPLHEIADLCAAQGMWFHIDGAYGAPAALCDQGKELLSGIERADSLVLDPHKWLFQPYDIGCTLVRRRGTLDRAFAMTSEYLKDVEAGGGQVDFRNRSLELTRRSRALKLWLTFRTYGCERIRQAIERGIQLAEFAEEVLRNSTSWEVITPAQIGIITFALKGNPAADLATRAQALTDSGFATLSSTLLKGRSVLRLCTINPLTTHADIEETIERLEP